MKRLLAMITVLGSMISGCAAYYDPYYYDYAYYDPYYYGYDSAYVYGWVDPYGTVYFSSTSAAQTTTIDLTNAAAQIAAGAKSYYTPPECVTATASGPTVNYLFEDCAGPFGLRSVSGQAALNLSETNGQLGLTASSTNLEVDGRPFILDLTATATRAGTQRVVTISSSSRSPAVVDSRTSQSTMSWEQGSGCIEVSGQGGSTRDDLTTTSTVTGYLRCADQCPSAGTVTVQNVEGTFTATFDGTDNLQVTAPDGSQKDYNLNCE
jgi:hypothetical protein